MKLTWYEGAKDGKRNLPPSSIFPDRGLAPSDSGSVIVGSLYRMYSPNDYGAKQVVWPKGDYVELKVPARRCRGMSGLATVILTRSESGLRPFAREAVPGAFQF